MEGPEKGRTITIKINGKHRSYDEGTKAEKEMNRKDREKEIETDRLIDEEPSTKNVNSSAFNEAAATKEAADDDTFDWILPEESDETDEIIEYQIATSTKKTSNKGIGSFSKSFKKNNRNKFLSTILLTVFFAILLGTSFGFILLKLVITEKEAETAQPATTEPLAEEQTEAKGSDSAVLQPLSTFVIQGGVFSKLEAAKQVQEEQNQNGVPSKVIEMNGQAVLYLSVASSIDEAKEIGNQLKSKGLKVFAKPITLNEKAINNLLPEEKKIIELAPAYYQVLTEGATEAELTNTLSSAMFNNIEKQASAVNTLEEGKLKNKKILSLKNELTNAYQQLASYKETKDAAALTKCQQHLLEFISIYYTL
ncbi:SPOR domain-containing protein [Cytobacillus depressus]|uniref:SPOR domain-containing protein n=1 Tax=Cytobacillus depressus TaxID=1602942 RepID=A0A6L3VAL7_9BACI|nr:SPOR domain-containing protein [Cytobacillus depressus]KAB2338716.1 SPOR domain-containing protein [Cytobacillus depressus]